MRTVVLASLLSSSTAWAATWQLDPTHSKVGFAVSHLMVSTVEGESQQVEASLDYEPDAGTFGVEVTVDLSSVDTANDQRDDHLRSSDFLDIANHPNMTFVSREVKLRRNGRFTIEGDLTLRGVTRSVTLEGRGLDQVVADPWGNTRVGASARGEINRKDFGVSWNTALETGGVLVGDTVELRIEAEFIRQD